MLQNIIIPYFKDLKLSNLQKCKCNILDKREKCMIHIQDKDNGVFIIKIGIKEVHTLDVPDLKDRLQQAIVERNIKKLVLDLSDVKLITSSGIGIFLNINKSLNSQFLLATPSEEVRNVLDLTKISTVITIFDTVDEALKAF